MGNEEKWGGESKRHETRKRQEGKPKAKRIESRGLESGALEKRNGEIPVGLKGESLQ